MKTLYLVRHAKSSWDDFQLTDFQRPLNDRGLRDAPRMAALLAAQSNPPEKLVSSPAERAITTARFFAEALGIAPAEILEAPRIYEASVVTIMEVIHELDDNWNAVALFGHNPAFSYVAGAFPGERVGDMPTCAIVTLSSTADAWADLEPHNTRISHFMYPKQ